MFGHVDYPAILIDAQRRIVATNRQGDQLLQAGTFLSESNGALSCADDTSQQELLAALEGHSADLPKQIVIYLPKSAPARRGAPRQVGVTLLKLARAGAAGQAPVTDAALTLLTFRNVPLSSLDLASNAIRCFGLTSAQARVAAELANGRTIKQIAYYSGVSVNTVRHHVKAIFAKTHTNRQVELVQMLSQLASNSNADAAADAAAGTAAVAPFNGSRGAVGRPASNAELPAH